jgi:cation:H+ antiporter
VHGDSDSALGTLLSSKVNQWTLLVGSLPIAHALGGGGTQLPLDARQVEEFLLTAGQALFAVAVIVDLRFRAREALLLFLAFASQLVTPQPHARLVFAALYVGFALAVLLARRQTIVPTLRAVVRTGVAEEAPRTTLRR